MKEEEIENEFVDEILKKKKKRGADVEPNLGFYKVPI